MKSKRDIVFLTTKEAVLKPFEFQQACDYLIKNGLKPATICRSLGISRMNLYRYRTGQLIPNWVVGDTIVQCAKKMQAGELAFQYLQRRD